MPRIEIKEYGSALKMLEEFGDWLEENAAVNNLLLGFLYRLGRREAAGGEVNALMLGVHLDGRPKVAMLHTPPREMMMVCGPNEWELPLEAATAWLRDRDIHIPGAVGPMPQTIAFAEAYAAQHHVVFRQKTMQLDCLRMPAPASGNIRLSEPRDADLIREWLQAFFQESLNKELLPAEAVQLTKAKILEKSFWVWEADGQAVSMAGVERPTRQGITVVLVYTPPAERGRGYASNLVAQITDLQLRTGRRFCCLHTDADNPTSNKIYQALGYYEVGEGALVRF